MTLDSVAWCLECGHDWEYDGRQEPDNLPETCPACGTEVPDSIVGMGPVYEEEEETL